jgi:hypothetical protein
MKNLAAVVFVVAGLVSLTYGQTGEWVKFSSSEGNFLVLLPIEPTFKAEKSEMNPRNARTGELLAEKVRYTSNMFASQGVGETYLVGWVDYQPGFTFDIDGELKANRDSFVKALNARLLTEKKITLGGNPGLEFSAKNDTTFFQSRVYIFGKRPYMLIAISTKPDFPNAYKFFSSFSFTKK